MNKLTTIIQSAFDRWERISLIQKGMIVFFLVGTLEIVVRVSPLFEKLPRKTLIFIAIIEAFVIAWCGSKHAYVYLHDIKPKAVKRSVSLVPKFEIHKTQMYGEFIFFALLILASVQPLVVFGAQFIGRIPFQGFINIATGRDFIDADESEIWTVKVGDETIVRDKFLSGRKSYLKLIIGISLVGLGVWL